MSLLAVALTSAVAGVAGFLVGRVRGGKEQRKQNEHLKREIRSAYCYSTGAYLAAVMNGVPGRFCEKAAERIAEHLREVEALA